MNLFKNKTKVKKVKKLSKKEIQARQEQQEKERAAELQRTYQLYRFTPEMWGNILALPMPHQDVTIRFTGLFSKKPMTVGEVADKIWKDDHYPLLPGHVEAMLSDAMEMTKTAPVSLHTVDCKITSVGTMTDKGYEKMGEMASRGYKILVREHALLHSNNKDKKKKGDVTLLVSSEEGFQSLNAIRDMQKDHIFGIVDYDFVMEHRAGLMTETHFSWEDAEDLVELSPDEDRLRDVLGGMYEDADIVRFPSIVFLYDYARADMITYKNEDSSALLKRIKQREETARKCAILLEKMGKAVISGFNMNRLTVSSFYEYLYLGREMALKALVDTPKRLAGEIPDFDLCGPGMRSLLLKDEDRIDFGKSLKERMGVKKKAVYKCGSKFQTTIPAKN